MQGGSGVVDLGGGEGEMSGGVAQRGGRGEGGGVGDGLLEQRLGGAGAVQAEQGLGAVVEQGGVGVRALGGNQRGVERVGLVGVVGIQVDAGQQAGDVGVLRIGGVEFFQQRRGLSDLGGIVGSEVGAGEQGGEGGVGWVGGEGGREQSFGVGGAVLGKQDVGKRGDGLRVCRSPRRAR